MEKKSWVCTLIAQFLLCVALFVALNIGRPQKPKFQISRDGRAPFDLYFVSARGGCRSLQEQIRLRKQVENVLKTYEVKFVVFISELGENDPLMQNATQYLQSLKVPWYTTSALKRQGADYFLKQFNIAQGKTLDLIALDTVSLKDPSSGTGRDQLHWLTKILETSSSNWRIVAGFDPMVACDNSIEQMETIQDFASLNQIFLKYGVDAYLSGKACTNHDQKGDIVQIAKGPYLTTINQKRVSHIEIDNAFLLHRVSSLEIATYSISMNGEVVHKITLQQQGKAVM